MIENSIEISKDQLLAKVQNMKYDGYRFITATSVDIGNGELDVIYHFDKDLTMKNYRVKVQKNESIPSISRIYYCALMVENEIKELFGLNITDIIIDYGGHLLLSGDALSAPMARPQIIIEKKEVK